MLIFRWLTTFISLALCFSVLLYQYHRHEVNEGLQQHVSELDSAFKAVLHNYRLATETIYYEVLLKPEVLNLFQQGIKAKEEQKQALRVALYNQLLPTYQRLYKRNLKQLHFHEPETANSFLRFHKPEKYGDRLIDVRRSLALINQSKQPVYGFEIGRIFSGFRYIYPLFSPEEQGLPHNYIGSVETSLRFMGIEQELQQLHHADAFALLLKGDAVFNVVFEAYQSRYFPSDFSADYFYENEKMFDFNQALEIKPYLKSINQSLAKDSNIEKNMINNLFFSVDIEYKKVNYVVCFIPIFDIEKQQVAYLVSYKKDAALDSLSKRLRLQIIIMLLALLFIFLLFFAYLKSQKNLYSNKMQLSAVFENAQVGIGLLQPNGFYIKVNQHFCHLFNYSESEVRQIHCRDLHYPDNKKESENILKKLVTRKINNWSEDKQFMRKNGEVFWGHHNLSALYDNKGQCIAVVCIITDFTEHKQNVEMLLKLSRAVAQSQNIVVITDLDGNIEFVNPAFTKTTGYNEAEVLGKKPRFLKSGKTSDAIYKELWETITHGKTWHGEFYNRCKDGSYYWESATISPIKDKTGQIQHYIAVKENITKRKQTEETLQKNNIALKQLNQEKNEFLAIAAHDLKNPLSAIQSLADEIVHESILLNAEEPKEYAKQIKIASKKMFSLVTNLLDVNSIESNKVQLETQTVDIYPLLEKVLQQYERAVQQKSIQLNLHSQQAPYYADISEDIFIQILDNLISNAVKYSPFSGVIDIFVEKNQHVISCAIQDQGQGLSFEEQKHLFGKFSRLSPKPTNGEHSTGLGLFIVKKLVEMLEGNVYCLSQVGQGSRFILELPLSEPPTTPKNLEKKPINNDLNILLAEDNAVNRMVAKLLLRKVGLSIDEAVDGLEAVSHCQQKNYDVVFMDMHMPRLNGVEASQQILQHHGNKVPYIIALTASISGNEKAHLSRIGIQDVIIKPLKKESLEQALIRYQNQQKP